MRDRYGRRIHYLRISLTDKCNLRCRYCMPEEGVAVKKHEDLLSVEELLRLSKIFVSLGIDKIRLTGGEPLVRRGVLDIVNTMGQWDLRDFAMTTNGILLDRYACDLKRGGLHRVNISLDTLREDRYRHITRGGRLEDVFRGLAAAEKAGLSPIKINVVLMKGFNEDEILDFVEWTLHKPYDIRFIELMPIGEGIGHQDESIRNETILQKAPALQPLESKDTSSPAKYYQLPKARGRVGLINPMSCKFCENCNRLRLSQEGFLKLCLHDQQLIDLRTPLREGCDMTAFIKDLVFQKPEKHQLEKGDYNPSMMNTIGG